MREQSRSRTTPPSILHSSRSRVAENSTSRTKPPVQMLSTVLSKPSTISAPVLPRRIRSKPSRSGVPGASAARVARCVWSAARSWAAMALLVAESVVDATVVAGSVFGVRFSVGRSSTARSRRLAVLWSSLPVDHLMKGRERVRDVCDLDDPHAVGHLRSLFAVGDARYQRDAEAEPSRLGQPPGEPGDRSHLAGEPYFAERDDGRRQWTVHGARGHGERYGEVGGRIDQAHAADRRRKHVMFPERYAAAAFEYRHDHRDPGGVEAGGGAARL